MKKRIFAYIFFAFLLTGCGQKIVQAPILEPTSSAVAENKKTVIEEDIITTPPQGFKLEIAEPVNVFDKVFVRDVISHPDIQVRNGSVALDTSETGDNKVEVSYIYDGKRYKHDISYTVEDTSPPVLLRSGDGSVAVMGESFDLNDHVGFADNYDRKPTLTYEGEVDMNTMGTYYLTATATDSAGNETTWDLSISVESEEPPYEDNYDRYAFEDLIADYEDENAVFGIDVSKWQYDIDFEAVKNAGCEFVIMRIGSYYDEYTLDSYFRSNMENALNAGLKVGVYIYTTANTEEEIKENVDWIVEQLDGQELDFPIVFDWEEFSSFQQYEMSINDLNNYYELFAKELEKNGYDAMLYSSKNFLNNFWYDHSDKPVWLAHFTEETDYDGRYAIWQMSSVGRIDGIEGDVDFNILYEDKAEFYNTMQ